MAIKYNMEFYTHITIPKTPFTFSYTVQTVLLGSCFAEKEKNWRETSSRPI